MVAAFLTWVHKRFGTIRQEMTARKSPACRKSLSHRCRKILGHQRACLREEYEQYSDLLTKAAERLAEIRDALDALDAIDALDAPDESIELQTLIVDAFPTKTGTADMDWML